MIKENSRKKVTTAEEIKKKYEESKAKGIVHRKFTEEELIEAGALFFDNAYLIAGMEHIIKKCLIEIPEEDLEKVKKITEVKEIKDKSIYNILPTNPIFSLIKRESINQNKAFDMDDLHGKIKHNRLMNGDLEIEYKGDGVSFLYKLNNPKNLGKKSIFFRKTFNYILIKINEQNCSKYISFTLDDYMNSLGYANKDSSYRALKKYSNNLLKIIISGLIYKNKKEVRSKEATIFREVDISYKNCNIEINELFFKDLMLNKMLFYTVLPKWANKLSTKAYDIVDYIYTQARQKQNQDNLKNNGYFNISFKSLNDYVGGYDPKETQKAHGKNNKSYFGVH